MTNRNLLLYGAGLGAMAASVLAVGTYFYRQNAQSAEELLADFDKQALQNTQFAKQVRDITRPCHERSEGLRSLVNGGEVEVSALQVHTIAMRDICQKQWGTIDEVHIKANKSHEAALKECKFSLHLESKLAEGFEKIALGEFNSSQESYLRNLGAESNSQLSVCDGMLKQLEGLASAVDTFRKLDE